VSILVALDISRGLDGRTHEHWLAMFGPSSIAG
jgi:hypothetical protein